MLIHELKGMSACKAPHLFKPLDRHQSGQRLALPLDDEFVLPKGDSVQHVSKSLPDIHRRNLICHLTTPSTIIVGMDAIGNLKSEVALQPHRALKRHLGDRPLDSLEEPDDINRLKTDSEYAEEVELATLHRTLETLRAAMNWGAIADCNATRRSCCSTPRCRR